MAASPAFGAPGRDVAGRGREQQRRPRSRADFEIAIVCALPLEYDAVSLLFDVFWDEHGLIFAKSPGDTNTYTYGRIGRHDVALVLLPGMGKVNASGAAMGLVASFANLKLAFLTGVCGAAPKSQNKHEVLLGDVVIADDVVQYDFGRQYPGGFVPRVAHRDRLARPNREIRSFLATLSSQLGLERLQQSSCLFLRQIQAEAIRRDRRPYVYPGAAHDKLFDSAYCHRHQGPSDCQCASWRQPSDPVCGLAQASLCSDTGCSDAALIPRARLEMRRMLEAQGASGGDVQGHAIFVGRVASGDTVMKSAQDRDKLIATQQVIGFEMEGAGLWEDVPCILVKGTCDYADSHKNKGWQDFAAATAAATTKAILERFLPADRPSNATHTTTRRPRFTTTDLLDDVGIPPPRSPPRWPGAPNTTGRVPSAEPPEKLLRDIVVESALASLPGTLCVSLRCTDARSLSTKWGSALMDIVKQSPSISTTLSNTIPFKQFITGVDKCIWYQVMDSATTEYEDVPLSVLTALEKDDERRRLLMRSKLPTKHDIIDKIDIGEQFRVPEVGMLPESYGRLESRNKVRGSNRHLLFYVASEFSADPGGNNSQLQTFLWSLITQLLLWRPKFMGLFLGRFGMAGPGSMSLDNLPGADRLRPFLLSLIELNGAPIVLTICHAEWMNEDSHIQCLGLIAELFQGQSRGSVSVHIIASAARSSAAPKFINAAQILNRDTERSECLAEFQFEGQFLRRNEVGAADEGTNNWIWTHPSFVLWSQRPSAVLWIEGKAGSGKSVLAKTIRSKLSHHTSVGQQGLPLPPISDWFYSTRHGDITRSHTAFLRSVLGQILEQNRTSFHHYAAIYRKKKEEHEEWFIDDYEQILRQLAANGVRAICIVDAMDESDDGGGAFELRARIIGLMAELCRMQSSQLKFVVSSRYTADISRALHKYWKEDEHLSHILLERENSGDILTLVEHGLLRLRSAMDLYESDDDERMDIDFPSDHGNTAYTHESSILSRMRGYLMESSDGVILWVKLTMQALTSRIRQGFYNLEVLEAELKSLPRGIIDYYKLTVRDLETRYSPEDLLRTKTALMWVVGASSVRPLALGELYEALCIPLGPFNSDVDPITNSPLRIHSKSWLGFYRQLRVRCGPLLEVIMPQTREFGASFRDNTEISPHFTIQLLHRTVKDFLFDGTESGALSFSQAEADELVRQSMRRYLELVMPTTQTAYCPVPARTDWGVTSLHITAEAMVRYLEGKHLLEFVLTAIPEGEVMPHLMIFENSFSPPLMEQTTVGWDDGLRQVSYLYFDHACREGLRRGMTNLLTISSILLVSWPTLLRYGALATALKMCTNKYAANGPSAARDPDVGASDQSSTTWASRSQRRMEMMEAIETMTAFSNCEQRMIWEILSRGDVARREKAPSPPPPPRRFGTNGDGDYLSLRPQLVGAHLAKQADEATLPLTDDASDEFETFIRHYILD
ncbi:hypothetical protein DL765_009350 [Monosporascus sp. GIB2]|nr:hypothetical protein DL765_009350 [Monosporascus sp. GIB2]